MWVDRVKVLIHKNEVMKRVPRQLEAVAIDLIACVKCAFAR